MSQDSFHALTPLDPGPSSAPRADAEQRQSLRLWLRLLRCSHRIEQTVAQRLRREFGTSLARFDYLAQLDPFPEGLRMKTLSRRLMVTGGNITGLTDQLLMAGHVTREVDVNDRRAHIVRMTPQGRAAFQRMSGVHRQWVHSLVAGMSVADRLALQHLLGELSASLDQGALS